ncbi:MAG: DNA-binding protein [Candidatus Methanoperedenaceae archaeon]|nr:MAG: DNA-binding protein [Candidatus Methanoperedenaceae archaeon]
MDYKDLATKWFNKANNDLIAGKYILTMPDPPADIICFHSQQSVEKYLKGFLAFHKLEIPRTHELEELISRCEEIDSEFSELHEISSELSSYAVDVRYPMEGNYDVTIEEARRAIDIAGKIKIFVLNKLKLS